MNELLNPYIAGAPITESSMFFGREEVFNWIERSLAGKYVDHILVLHGQRRVGKTSVLKQIPNFLDEKYIQVFFDLQGRTNTTLDRFLWWLAREIARTLTRDHGIEIPRPNRQAFQEDTEYLIADFLPSLESHLDGRILLLTFDEFDTLAQEDIQETLAEPLIAYLRRLMDVDGLNFIFSIGSSGSKLENMQASYTDFFKTALYRKISFLDKKSCQHLITKPVEGVIDYGRRAPGRIYEITAGHPYFTQLMCHELFSLCQRTGARKISQEDVESVIEDVIERGTVNLKFVWDEASDLEKWSLASLAQEGDGLNNQALAKTLREQRVRFVENDLNSALIHLQDKDVLTQDNDFIIYLMRLWLERNRPLERVREELAEVNPIANRFIEIGDEYHNRGQFENALNSYKQALEAAPRYLKAQLSIATTLLENNSYPEAVSAFEKSLDIDPVDVASQTGLCDALLAWGDEALNADETEVASARYRRILTHNQSHIDARQRLAGIHRERAEASLSAGDDDAALSDFNQALEYTPEDEELSARYHLVLEEKRAKVVAGWLKKADRALGRQRWEEAAGFIEEALKLDPENQDLRTKLAEVKDAPRQFKIREYKQTAEQALGRGNFKKAITALETAVVLSPEDRELAARLESTREDQKNAQLNLYQDRAKKAIAAGDWEAAISARQEALKLSPDDPDLQEQLEETKAAQLRSQLEVFQAEAEQAIAAGDWDTAVHAYEQATKLAPEDSTWKEKIEQTRAARLKSQLDAFQAQADQAVEGGRWEEALQAIRGAIKIAPDDAPWKEQLTDIEEARHQTHLVALREAAQTAHAAEDWDTAISALEGYLKLEPGAEEIRAEIEAIRRDKRQSLLSTFKAQAQTATTEEKWSEVAQAWKSYLDLEPEDAEEIEEPLQHARKYAQIASDYAEAEKALRKKNFGRAVNLLQGVIAQDPTYKSTSRLLVEAVEAKGQAPVWKSAWVYPAVGAILLVILGIIFVPKVMEWSAFLKPANTPISSPTLTTTITPTVAITASPTTTPTPTPHPGQVFAEPILAYVDEQDPTFEDDFSEPNQTWNYLTQDPSLASYEIEEGTLHLELQSGGEKYTEVFLGEDFLEATNFVLQFEYCLVESESAHTIIGIDYHAIEGIEGEDLSVEIDANTGALQGRDIDYIDRPVTEREWTKLKLVAVDGRFAVYVNDIPVAYYEHETLSGSRNLIKVFTSAERARVNIDNIKFWNLDNTVITQNSAVDGMTMSYIPAGEFMMGNENGDDDESTVHAVYLDAFWIDQTEVTVAQFSQFAEETGSLTKVCGDEDDHPVGCVPWYTAQDYCEWAGRRLPTEAEWEKAARGGLEGKTYPWGDSYPVCTAGAENGAQISGCGEGTVAVKTFAPNGYGLYDLIGNVSEWVSDSYMLNYDYYKDSPYENPEGAPRAQGDFRVLRGGAWYSSARDARLSNRYYNNPGYPDDDFGFRCAKDIELEDSGPAATGPATEEASTPTPTPTPTLTGEASAHSEPFLTYIDSTSPTFEDDFSTVKSDWGKNSEFSYVTEYIADGQLSINEQIEFDSSDTATYDKGIPGLTFPINGLFSALDFSLQFDFKMPPSGSYENFIGVHFRSPYDENFAFDQKVGYALYITQNGEWSLKKDNNETQIAVGEVSLGSGISYNNLNLIVKGEYMAVFVNNELLYEKTDLDANGPGRFTEIVLSGSQNNLEFIFDNVKYWNLEGVEIP